MGIGSEHKNIVPSVVRSNINSLEREVNELKKEHLSIRSSISSLKDEIQKLEKNTKILLQGLKNVTNTLNVSSTRHPAPVEPRTDGTEYWMLFPPEIDDNGIQWARHKSNGCWYYRDFKVGTRWNKSDS